MPRARNYTPEENAALICPQDQLNLVLLSNQFGRPISSLSRQRGKLLGRPSYDRAYQRAKQKIYHEEYKKPKFQPKPLEPPNPRFARPDWFSEPDPVNIAMARR